MPHSTSNTPQDTRRIIILGATGSIGRQAIEIIQHLAQLAKQQNNPPPLRIVALSAATNAKDLFTLAHQHNVTQLALSQQPDIPPPAQCDLRTGKDASAQLVREVQADIVLGAIVGIAGLPAVYAAVELGIDVALANKESLVAGGSLIMHTALQTGARILPVDSEHAALWQCLGRVSAPPAPLPRSVRKLILTASGGPFRTWPADRINTATPDDALRHPTWSMGPKVTIDCATLMNKALELIEAHWLFGAPADQLDVLVHPGSISHAIVQFTDGSSLAQLASPTMRIPIQQALTHPAVHPADVLPSDLASCSPLAFEPVDHERFPAINLASDVIRQGGLAGTILNAANEAAVHAFLQRTLPFGCIVQVATNTLHDLLPHYKNTDTHDMCAILQVSDHARAHAAAQCASSRMTTGITPP